jgi:hypothetical protein
MDIAVNLLKQVINELASYLAELFNRSLATGFFPSMYARLLIHYCTMVKEAES